MVTNATLQQPTLIPAPPLARQPELSNYSNYNNSSLNPISLAKTSSSEVPRPIHTVSNIDNAPKVFNLISGTSIPDPLSSHFSSPTLSKTASNPYNPAQGAVTNIERLLSQSQWNHSFNIVSASPSFSTAYHLQSLPFQIPLDENHIKILTTALGNNPTIIEPTVLYH